MHPRVIEWVTKWEREVSIAETSDALWQLHAYRLSRCLLDQVNDDCRLLGHRVDRRTIDQLLRAVGSIGANIGEGYSRRSLAERARFYGYALGSQREAMLWYQSIAWALDAESLEVRLLFLDNIRRLLLGLIRSVQDRGGMRFEARRRE